jgi:hypothetical protein
MARHITTVFGTPNWHLAKSPSYSSPQGRECIDEDEDVINLALETNPRDNMKSSKAKQFNCLHPQPGDQC